jgi:hypothetical protein
MRASSPFSSCPAGITHSTHVPGAAQAVSKKMKNAISSHLALICLAFSSTAYAGTVAMTSPGNGSMVNSPVHVHATYSSTVTATYMKLWVDHAAGTVEHNTNVFDTQVSLANGTHLLEVQASDPSTGKIYTTAAQITVAALAVNPPSTSLPPGAMQQFTATDSTGASITWSATGGTISSGGLYTAGSITGTFAVTATDSSGNKAIAQVVIASLHTVTIENPKTGSTRSSPVLVHATYNGTVIATYMKIWVDHIAGSVQHNTNSFTTSLNLASGPHLIEVQASDPSTGQVYTTPTNITVTGGSAGTVTVSPATVILPTGGTQQFTATDSAGLPVTWSATGGTISSGGLYTAGTTTGTFTVTARDSSNSKGTASVTIQSSAPTVTVSPATVILPTGGTQQFTATDSAGLPVTWSATGGTISSSGLYTAGTTTGTFTVTATDSSNSKGTASVTIQSSAPTVTIQNPVSGSTVTSPLNVHATYNRTAGYMKLWIDHVASTVQLNTNVFDTYISLANGPHLVEVQAQDASTGTIYTTPSNITVSGVTSGNYTTWKNDNLRTGQQRNEIVLAPANVNSTHFGVLFSASVDGMVFAQPLYLANQPISGGTHNVVFVATEHDSVYAFDADTSGAALWHTTLIPVGAGTVPQSLVGSTIYPEIGITGTPVIDPSLGTLYVVSETLESGSVVFRLHALNVTTGKEQGGSPVVINTSGWQPKEQLQRPGLLLSNGNVYIAFGSQGDNQPYHGWIFSYSAGSLAQVGIWNSTPTGSEGAIWMSGSGLAADSSGDIYAMTGNGSWDGTSNFSDSFVKLSPNLTLLDYFTPYNEATLSVNDQDLGSGGVLLVPDQSGAFQHEIIGCGKIPAIYVLNRDNMGKFQSGSNSQIIQEVDNQVGGTTGKQAPDRCFLTPAFWQQNVYFTGSNDVIKAFRLDPTTSLLSSTPTSKGSFNFVFPGAQPVVSSNGASNGIVWAVDYASSVALHAYDATNMATELYRSAGLGAGAKWAVPMVVNGKVYVGTAGKLVVFGSM